MHRNYRGGHACKNGSVRDEKKERDGRVRDPFFSLTSFASWEARSRWTWPVACLEALNPPGETPGVPSDGALQSS